MNNQQRKAVTQLRNALNNCANVGLYWYGFGQNTSDHLVQTAGECKSQVKEYIKSKGL